MSGLVVVALLVGLAFLAPRYGADSREGRRGTRSPDQRHSVLADLRTAGRAVRRAWAAMTRAAGRMWREQELACEALLRVQQPWLADRTARGRTARDRGARDRTARDRGELRWRRVGRRGWRLEGCLLPSSPPTDQRSGR